MKKNGNMRFVIAAIVVLVALAVPVIWPRIDLAVSGWFYRPNDGFFLANAPFFDVLRIVAHAASRILGFFALILTVVAASQRRPVLTLDAKAWLFLFLGLVIGPGLVANMTFKDHWGRARPRDVAEFGGGAHFTPALIPADQCDNNCSFVSGDGAFGFYLPAIAYVMPPPKSRRYYWGAMGLGSLFAFGRLVAGGHFLSDNLFAAFFMQIVLALLYAAMNGREALRERWRNWMFLS